MTDSRRPLSDGLFIDMATKDPDIPALSDGPDVCPCCGGELIHGYGLAGGGIGVYLACAACALIVAKDEDES